MILRTSPTKTPSNFGTDYQKLLDWELKLFSIANVLASFNRDAFLQEEIEEAFDFLNRIAEWHGLPLPDGGDDER